MTNLRTARALPGVVAAAASWLIANAGHNIEARFIVVPAAEQAVGRADPTDDVVGDDQQNDEDAGTDAPALLPATCSCRRATSFTRTPAEGGAAPHRQAAGEAEEASRGGDVEGEHGRAGTERGETAVPVLQVPFHGHRLSGNRETDQREDAGEDEIVCTVTAAVASVVEAGPTSSYVQRV